MQIGRSLFSKTGLQYINLLEISEIILFVSATLGTPTESFGHMEVIP